MNPLDVDGDIPPSARHVVHALQERGPLTQQEIIAVTNQRESTVDDALRRLVDEEIIDYHYTLADARARRYYLRE